MKIQLQIQYLLNIRRDQNSNRQKINAEKKNIYITSEQRYCMHGYEKRKMKGCL